MTTNLHREDPMSIIVKALHAALGRDRAHAEEHDTYRYGRGVGPLRIPRTSRAARR